MPHLPQGWQALWDPVGLKWAYLESWNNKISWIAPNTPSFGEEGNERSHVINDERSGYYAGGYGGYDEHGKEKKKVKSNDKKNLAMGVAAGVAVGAVGGVVVASALGMHIPYSSRITID